VLPECGLEVCRRLDGTGSRFLVHE
jgi:hypothetical protein